MGPSWNWSSPTGAGIPLLASAAPVRDAGEHIVGSVAAYVDITAQKDLQKELDRRRREAEDTSVRKTRFLAAVSHDIRTPANAISLLAELIRRSASNSAMAAEVPELAQELHNSAKSLVNLVSDVLEVTRFDISRIDLQPTDFPLGDLLEQECRQLAPLAQGKPVRCVPEKPQPPLWVHADRIKLGRVLGNLLGNGPQIHRVGRGCAPRPRGCPTDGSKSACATPASGSIPSTCRTSSMNSTSCATPSATAPRAADWDWPSPSD